ncbi:histidine phosphatase family protein [Roseovarius faecimaris]|uniref:Histidine phosphatase family protein n=1 Tax=Roseovarius faecimaris TaxID=2494550 RepID=A0A6I6IT12_9RHOB|nr:histidine phosphatase family protein [Roseovarius faecimaris]QGX98657.1 histidine phosphatase family protein [Roseovarius faecimaris]
MSDYPKIWFLRHGETEWNAERRIQGQLESKLTPRGIGHAEAQARLMAPILKADPPCFVSPLGRAQQTAQIALGARAYVTDPRLAEAHAGDWQGLLHADVRRDHPELLPPETTALDLFLKAPGGEGFAVFHDRILAFMRDLTEPSVVVAHGLLGQVMRGLILGLPHEEMGTLSNEQACVYVLENGSETVLREAA